MLKNLKNLIAGWRKSAADWYAAHRKLPCAICYTPTLLKDLKVFKRLQWTYRICPDCCSHPGKFNRFLYRCDRCGMVLAEGFLTEFNNKLLCRNCLNERSFCCPECHERKAWFKKFVAESTLDICKTCADKFERGKHLLSEEDKAFLEKCHKRAIKVRQPMSRNESSCGTRQKIKFKVCTQCRKSILPGDEVFIGSMQKTFCIHCAVALGFRDYYKHPVAKQVNVDNSLRYLTSLKKHSPVCQICSERIFAGEEFHSTCLLEYCNACGRKLGLTRYTPPEDPEKTKKKYFPGKKRKQKSAASDEVQEEQVSYEEIQQKLADAQLLSMMAGSQRTLRTIFSDPPPPPSRKPSFSTNNYYHPDFDDNEEDDFVLDGIGGLDGKYDV